MATPECRCIAGLPLAEQVGWIYRALYERSSDVSGLPLPECINQYSVEQKFDSIYCLFYRGIGPTPPGNLATLLIEWDDESTDEDGFRIEISTNGSAYTTAGETGADVETFLIEGLQWNTLYYVRVFAFNESGDSPPAGPIAVYTATEEGPTDADSQTVSDTTINVTWTDSVTQPENGGYRVRYKKSSDGSYDENDFEDAAIGEESLNITGLDASTSYDFYVVTFNDNSANVPPQVDSESAASNTTTSTTSAPIIIPTVSSLTIPSAGTTLVVVFSETCVFGSGGSGGLTLSATGGAVTATYASGANTNTFTYNLSRTIAFSETITASYVQPGNGIENLTGNDLASFTNQPVTNNVPDTGTSPGLTGIVAWYDFGNANDADGGTLNLSEQGGPTYNTGNPNYGISTNGAPGAFWQQTSLDNSGNFGADTESLAFACRFQLKTGIANNDYIVFGNGGRNYIRYTTSGLSIICAFKIINTGILLSLDTWYTVVVTYDHSVSITRVSVNGANFISSSNAAGGFATGTFFFGANSGTDSNPTWIDWCCFYKNKVFTQSNATWFYNSGGTRTYAEL